MPSKDPTLWTFLIEQAGALQVAAMGTIVALVRVIWDQKEKRWQRIALEGFMCGLFAVAADEVVRSVFHLNLPLFIATCAGAIGSQTIIMQIRKFFKRYTDRTPGDKQQ